MNIALTVSQIVLIGGSLLGLYRMFIGPRMLNRILALEYICGCIIGLIALHCIEKRSADYMEMILMFSLLGFATVVAFMEVLFFFRKGES